MVDFDELFDMEILGNPKFYISSIVGIIITFLVIRSWSGEIPGVKGYYFMAIIGSILAGWILTIRDIDKNG